MNNPAPERDRGFERKDFAGDWVGKASFFIFRWRAPLLWLFILITVLLAASATRLQVAAGFTKMIPLNHEYMKTFLEYRNDFGGANKVLVAVNNTKGDIYTQEFMERLRQVAEEVFFIKGVERSSVTSLFSPNVRYTEVVEDGFRGGNIVAADFVGTPEQLAQVRENVQKSDWVGRIVSGDQTAAMVVATLQEQDPDTGGRLNLQDVAKKLEEIRGKYERDGVTIHIIGFAKAIGDIAQGAASVLAFFGVAFVITALLLYWYSGSLMLTSWALICAVVPVIWLLGLLPVFGLTLDPMSILVPFLIFSIAVSHAVQMTNAWKLETLHGADGVTASRLSFQKLFVPGAVALLANALGFLVIAFVDIEMVRELTITATLGVTVMIITNKMLLPILLSYRHFTPAAAQKLRGMETKGDWLWEKIGPLAGRKAGGVAIAIGLVALALGLFVAKDLKIGDLGKGVPELREDARYNRDVELITGKFAIGVDLLQVIVEAKGREAPCVERPVMDRMEEFELQMNQVDGVATVRGLAGFIKQVTQAYAENFVKWRALPEEKAQIAQGVGFATRLGFEFMNSSCTAMPVSIFTSDHQATTIARVVDRIKAFKAANDSEELTFRLASGNVGVMAATNEVVAAADRWVNFALFASVSLLCLVTFRSWRVTLCIILPLALVTVLCNAVMTLLGIGVKVNTLPVVALGVGVGVDYGIYLFETMKHAIEHQGLTLRQAFVFALKQRGTASVFTAVTMTVSVATWTLSALKFQADMGILLAFMFLVNMLGAILLLPALAAYLVGERLRPAGTARARRGKPTAAAAVFAALMVGLAAVPERSAAVGLAAVPERSLATEAAALVRLGAELTPVGAERAGNQDGSIPPWTGGLTRAPEGWNPAQGYVDPFAGEEPLFTITADNADRYKDRLTPGMHALLKRWPGFQVPVYATHRTAALPAAVTDLAREQAPRVALKDGGVDGAGESNVPFPIPANALEAIWNHLLRYKGGGTVRGYSRLDVRDGAVTETVLTEKVIADSHLEPRPPQRHVFVRLDYLAPPALAGTSLLVHEPLGQPGARREVWSYNVGQRRIRKLPDFAYDSEPMPPTTARVVDQFDGYNGVPDRFDWNLVGKREMFVPYNAYRLGSKRLRHRDVLDRSTVKPELMRYELHRVWVVEAVLKPGVRHVYGRRVFYLDEDSWTVVAEDDYDSRGGLWRVGVHPLIQAYDAVLPVYRANLWHDLADGRFTVEGLDNETKVPWQFGVKGRRADFDPEAMSAPPAK